MTFHSSYSMRKSYSCEQLCLETMVLGKEIQKVVPSSNSARCCACCFSGTLKNSSQPFLLFVLVSSGCANKYHRLCFNHRTLSLHCSRVSKSKIEVLAGLVSPEASLLGLKIAIPTANSHRAFPLGGCLLACLPLLIRTYVLCMLLPPPSHFSRVRLCVMPQMTAHQAPPSLGFSRQEHWRGLPFPSPMHESEK